MFQRPKGGLSAIWGALTPRFDAQDFRDYPFGLADLQPSYDAVSAREPGIIYYSISGFGQTGPLAARPAMDPVLQAFTGIVTENKGEHDLHPHRIAISLIDMFSGLLGFQAIATSLEKIWLNELPIVPLFIGPRWSTYSTKYFHGFASPKNYYGDPIFTTFPDNVLSFTRIAPGGKAGA